LLIFLSALARLPDGDRAGGEVVKLTPSDRSSRSPKAAADLSTCLESFEHEFDFIYRTLRRNGITPADVEDLAHEVFLVMWRRWAEYDRERPLRPWLAGIAFRLAYNHKARAGREIPGGMVDTENNEPSPVERFESARDRALVQRVLSTLGEKQRAVMLLHDVEGVPMRTISEELGIPLQTAYSRLRVARKLFAKSLRRDRTTSLAREDLSAVLRADLEPAGDEGPPPPPKAKQRVVSRARALFPLAGAAGGLPASGDPGPLMADPATVEGLAAGRGLLLRTGLGAFGLGAAALLTVWALRSPSPATGVIATPEPAAPASARRSRSSWQRPVFAAVWPGAVTLAGPREDPEVAAARAALGRGLIGYWRFDDGRGSNVARDASGSGNDCTMHQLDPATDWTGGPLGGALALNGHGWLECPRIDALARLGKEISIAAWIKRSRKHLGVTALVSRQLGSGGFDHFHLGFRSDRLWLRSILPNTSAPGSDVPQGRWSHVAGTLGADGVARVFLDGEEIGRKERAGRPSLGGGTTPLVIGGAVNTPDPGRVGESLTAVVDELVIYDRALAQEEIRALAAGIQPRL
jgi:RNA polymerase sigma-70 factor (ECF subfamily)